jgi:outer membrane protein assembly factor BamE (lipoprotein component of BamABCDE complex)
LGGFEELCPWNPLIDTQHSENFNVYNLDKIEEDMASDEIESLIGDPLEISKYKDNTICYIYTWDAASKIGDYAWLYLRVYFKNNRVIEIKKEWVYD